MQKRFIIFILLLVVVAGVLIKKEKTGFFLKNSEFVNSSEGYVLRVPKDFKIDKSFLPHTIRLVSDACTIEIYSQLCDEKQQMDSYINYTNQAVTSNCYDYSNVKEINSPGKTVLLWERKKLSRIKNDKNHYIKTDIRKNDRVYTIFVKSTEKITDFKKYEALLEIRKPSGDNNVLPKVKYPSGRSFNDETSEFYNDVFINSNTIEWGIYQPDFIDMPHINYIEDHISHKFNLVLQYSDFLEKYNPAFVRSVLDKAYLEGRVVELTLQPCRDSRGENTLFSVLDGKYDEFLHAYARDVADFSHPVIFRFCNEMNGDWCEYSGYRMSLDTELYRHLYHYVYDIFDRYNANNVIWVWNPNGKSFPDFKWNSEQMYYPGDKYVDVLGLTLYNTGNFYEGEEWNEFDELYRQLYDKEMKEYKMPFMITEFASARCGGNKELWTKNMLKSIGNYDNIKAAVWWNGADYDNEGNVARAYYINDSMEMVNVFREYFETNK